MSQAHRFSIDPWARVALLATLALGGLTGCEDNVACVFSTGCVDGGGGLSGNPAVFPFDGQTILDTSPSVVEVSPSGLVASGLTPITIAFSESMAPGTLIGAIEIVPLDVSGFEGPPIPGVVQTLLGDGHFLLLLPPSVGGSALTPGDYIIRLAEGALITDVTGQALTDSGQLGTFSVDTDDNDFPSLVSTWPVDVATGISTTTEIIVLFDRPLDPTSVSDSSFIVEVGGNPPAFDPVASVLSIDLGPTPQSEPRGLVYQSVDANDDPVSLGTGAGVTVELSPPGFELLDTMGGELENRAISFTTVAVEPPVNGSLQSSPMDAIGRANLTAGGDALQVRVELLDGQAGDEVDAFLFGTSTEEMPQTIALRRSVTLSGMGMLTEAFFSLADLDFLSGTTPDTARFADGAVAFAFRIRRGGAVSQLRILDVDPAADGIQDPVLDTVAPEIIEFLNPGEGVVLYRTDQRDIVLAGRASEPLACVEVTTGSGDNLMDPVALRTYETDLFLTQPIPAGVLAADESYNVVGFDLALNPSAPVLGGYRQLGAIGPGAFTPGALIDVRVFDAETLDPISMARLMTHGDAGAGSVTPGSAGMTDATGFGQVLSPVAPEVLLTVDAPGYDLFTFHGVESTRIDVPLRRSTAVIATTAGALVAESLLAQTSVPMRDRRVSDSRLFETDIRLFATDNCSTTVPLGVTCPFGPRSIQADRLGAQSVLVGDFGLDLVTFNAPLLLQAFGLTVPLAPVDPLDADATQVSVPALLTELAADEFPIEITPFAFQAPDTLITELGTLDTDDDTTGDPRIAIEALTPGVAGSTVVGLGLAVDVQSMAGNTAWTVRAAHPGAVSDMGFLSQTGVVSELYVRAELKAAMGGARAGARVPVDGFGTLPTPGVLEAYALPSLTSPAPGGSSPGASYDLGFADTLPDALGTDGLYRVRLTDDDGRGWELWRRDATGGAAVRVHVPDLVMLGGTPLTSGDIDCQLAAFTLPGRPVGDFLWSDLEREGRVFSIAASVTYTQP